MVSSVSGSSRYGEILLPATDLGYDFVTAVLASISVGLSVSDFLVQKLMSKP